MLALVIVLSLAAAFSSALSALFEQREASKEQHGPLKGARNVTAFMRRLIHRKLWVTGWMINHLGFFFQAAALQLSSVALVQPILVTQVLFAMILTATTSARRPGLRDWLYALSICAGLVVLLSVGGAAPLKDSSDRGLVSLALVALTGLVAVLWIVARSRSGQLASLLLAIGAGCCYAATAVLMKLTTEDLFGRGVLHTALDWPGYSLALATVTGLVLKQSAFASGSLPWSFAAMSITNPVVSYLIGILAFNAVAPHTPGSLAAVSATAVLIAIGVTGLSHSPLARVETQAPTQQAVSS